MGVSSKPGRTKGGNVGVILTSTSCARRRWSGSFGTPSSVSRKFLVPLYLLVNCLRCVIDSVTYLLVSNIFLRPPFFWHLNLRPVPSYRVSLTNIIAIHATHSSPRPSLHTYTYIYIYILMKLMLIYIYIYKQSLHVCNYPSFPSSVK